MFATSHARRWLALLALSLGLTTASAEPSLPWTPSRLARHHLQLLVDDGGLELPLMQWPLPAEAVADALDRLPATLPPAHAAARSQVERELATARRSSVRLSLRTPGDRLTGFGDDSAPASSVAVQSDVVEGRFAVARLGVRVESAQAGRDGVVVRPEGSAVATELRGLLLQARSAAPWWGPGWQSSLVLGHGAPAVTAVSLQRAAALPSESPWLSWLGPWNFEFFVGGLEGTTDPAHAFLVGNRLSLRPWGGLELGFTRTAQWGGRGRNQSARGFVDMLVGRNLNVDDPATRRDDPANALGGFDLRLRCPFGVPCAGYVQAIGEDEAGHLPSKYLGLYGLEAWTRDGRHRVFAELAETGCRMPIGRDGESGCAYRNTSYPEGYVHRGRWLGSSFGPDSRVVTVGWLDATRALSVRAHHGRVGARVARRDDVRSDGRLNALSARRSWPLAGGATLTPDLEWMRIGRDDALRAGITIEMPLRAGW